MAIELANIRARVRTYSDKLITAGCGSFQAGQQRGQASLEKPQP